MKEQVFDKFFRKYSPEKASLLISQLIERKKRRFLKRKQKEKSPFRLKRIDGVLHQICEWQPNYDESNWCPAPCNGDC